jgi:hypothetical protein
MSTAQKGERREKKTTCPLSPINKKACHNINTALLQSIMKIIT